MCELPDLINIGWNKCRVREYIPRARRCFKCQGYQHSSKNCRSEVAICVNCGKDSHGNNCDEQPSCKNCKGSHPASSKDCYYFKLATEIAILQAREKLNYREAKHKAQLNIPKPENLFSSAVKRTRPSKNPANSYLRMDVDPSKPTETTNDRKRTNTDNSSDSEEKTTKKSKPQGECDVLPILPPVSNESQETAQLFTPNNRTQNQQQQSPFLQRKAAITASQKISACQAPKDAVNDTPAQVPKTHRSRSTSKHRQKPSGSQ